MSIVSGAPNHGHVIDAGAPEIAVSFSVVRPVLLEEGTFFREWDSEEDLEGVGVDAFDQPFVTVLSRDKTADMARGKGQSLEDFCDEFLAPQTQDSVPIWGLLGRAVARSTQLYVGDSKVLRVEFLSLEDERAAPSVQAYQGDVALSSVQRIVRQRQKALCKKSGHPVPKRTSTVFAEVGTVEPTFPDLPEVQRLIGRCRVVALGPEIISTNLAV